MESDSISSNYHELYEKFKSLVIVSFNAKLYLVAKQIIHQSLDKNRQYNY